MESLINIGPQELLFIFLLAFLLLGPKEMILLAKRAGVLVRKVYRAPWWKELSRLSTDIREMPTRMVREAGLDEIEASLREQTEEIRRNSRISVNLQDSPPPPQNPVRPDEARTSASRYRPPQPRGSTSILEMDTNTQNQPETIQNEAPPEE